MPLMLSACTQTVPVVKTACPQIPSLPTEFRPAQVNAMQRTEQSFKDFMSDSSK